MAEIFVKHLGYSIKRKTKTEEWLECYRKSWLGILYLPVDSIQTSLQLFAESQSRHKRKADEYVEKRLDL